MSFLRKQEPQSKRLNKIKTTKNMTYTKKRDVTDIKNKRDLNIYIEDVLIDVANNFITIDKASTEITELAKHLLKMDRIKQLEHPEKVNVTTARKIDYISQEIFKLFCNRYVVKNEHKTYVTFSDDLKKKLLKKIFLIIIETFENYHLKKGVFGIVE